MPRPRRNYLPDITAGTIYVTVILWADPTRMMLQDATKTCRQAGRLRRASSCRTSSGTKPVLVAVAMVLALPVAVSLGADHAEDQDVAIPNIVPRLTNYFTTGQITEAEWVTAIRYMMDEKIIRLGEPDPTNPELVEGTVTKNIDGNTIEIDGTRIRIPLVDVVDSGDKTAPHAILAKLFCPVGSPAQYDIDDLQVRDKYGRTVAAVYCNAAVSLGEIMIVFGLGWINEWYCDRSEFERAAWAEGVCW